MQRIFFSKGTSDVVEELEAIKDGCWLHVEDPSETEIIALADSYGLDIDMIKDGIDVNESPRFDKWNDNLYIYTRFCLPESQSLTTAPMVIIVTEQLVISVCLHSFSGVNNFVKGTRQLATRKRAQLVLQILDEINSGYKTRINSISKRMWAMRAGLNKAHIANSDFVNLIDLEEDLNDFLEALEPMRGVLASLMTGRLIRVYEDDKDLIEDISLATGELITLAESRLRTITNIREAYSTIMANNLNKVFKLMTSITILMSIFTIITGIYSMNISLPGAHNSSVFWVILGVSGVIISGLAIMFRRKKWL
jgi:magnesium transporter